MRQSRRAGLGAALVFVAGPSLSLPGLSRPGLAAERPQPQKPPREVMLPCPKQGPGFVRVPGSQTCLRVSGRAVGGVDAGPHGTAPVTAGQLSIDTRTESDLGPFRAFVRMGHGRP